MFLRSGLKLGAVVPPAPLKRHPKDSVHVKALNVRLKMYGFTCRVDRLLSHWLDGGAFLGATIDDCYQAWMSYVTGDTALKFQCEVYAMILDVVTDMVLLGLVESDRHLRRRLLIHKQRAYRVILKHMKVEPAWRAGSKRSLDLLNKSVEPGVGFLQLRRHQYPIDLRARQRAGHPPRKCQWKKKTL
jgi:hypothetical protein